jgi:hypothetical protein
VFSFGKTTGLAGGILMSLGFLAIAFIPELVLGAGSGAGFFSAMI